jgi:hypothetical protein
VEREVREDGVERSVGVGAALDEIVVSEERVGLRGYDKSS